MSADSENDESLTTTAKSQEIPKLLLRHILGRESFARKVLPFLKKEYFEGEQRILFELLIDYAVKYNSFPTHKSLEIEFSQSDRAAREDTAEAVSKLMDEVFVYTDEDRDTDTEWLVDLAEKWCKDRAVFLAIIRSVNIIDGGEKGVSAGSIPDMLSEALSVSFDSHVGHDYIEQWKERYDYYHRDEEKIPFDLKMLNTITNGGVSAKTLNILMASTGVGKSLVLCHLASAMLSQGRNVLYLTMEMAEEKIAERIDANLMDTDIHELYYLSKTEYEKKIHRLKQKSNGKLVIKEYPTSMAHVGHFRALLKELKTKRDFEPDVIIIDYLNICGSSRITGMGNNVNSYTYVKSIAEEVRALAVEQDVPVWTATQTNRQGAKSSDVDETNTSESWGLPATADLMLALISSEELEEMDQIMIKQLKNRYNDPTRNRKFVLGIDRPKMRLYNLESTAQTNLADSNIVRDEGEDEHEVSDFDSFRI